MANFKKVRFSLIVLVLLALVYQGYSTVFANSEDGTTNEEPNESQDGHDASKELSEDYYVAWMKRKLPTIYRYILAFVGLVVFLVLVCLRHDSRYKSPSSVRYSSPSPV